MFGWVTIREGIAEIVIHEDQESSWWEFCQKGSGEVPEEVEGRTVLAYGWPLVTEHGRCEFSLGSGKGSLNCFEWREKKLSPSQD